MVLRRGRLRLAGIAAAAAVALLAAGCGGSSGGGSSSSSSGSSGAAVTGGTARVALPPGVTYNWIFPFYAITNASEYNSEQFQWLMYRPLYMFGNNTNNSVADQLPAVARQRPGVQQRRQDRHDHDEGLEVVQRRDR